jgi:hypothetical protein
VKLDMASPSARAVPFRLIAAGEMSNNIVVRRLGPPCVTQVQSGELVSGCTNVQKNDCNVCRPADSVSEEGKVHF